VIVAVTVAVVVVGVEVVVMVCELAVSPGDTDTWSCDLLRAGSNDLSFFETQQII
jgi:hypothetical protein